MPVHPTKPWPESDPVGELILPRVARWGLLLTGHLPFALALSACASSDERGTGAAVGAAAGAIIGDRMDEHGFDVSTIRADAAQNLRRLAASLERYPDTELLVVGQTDATGSDSYHQELSDRRAQANRRIEVAIFVDGEAAESGS